MSKEDKGPWTVLGPALQDTAKQPDELVGLSPKLGQEKDQMVMVKEEQKPGLKSERYVPFSHEFSTETWI